jgi:signal transduction histidine kinase
VSLPAGPSAVRDAITRAVLQLASEAHLVREDVTATGEVRERAASLADALGRIADGADPADLELPATPLTRRLLALLRARFVEHLAGLEQPPEGAELLRFLAAFERLNGAVEPPWDQRFADRLTGPDGLDLVVEVAHDLRSPLTSILFLAETLLRARSGPVTPLQERQLGLIYSAAFGLSSVASDVVELVRGRDRLVDLEPLPYSINDIFESVRDIVRPIAEEKGLEIRLDLPANPVRLGHPVAVNRILLNLTTNALKFTDQGSVYLAAAERGGDLVEFSVTDTGRGIPPSAMTLLFEPFRRRQREREYAFSGSGLGLSICRRLVEALGSELRVETVLGKGTRFAFTLALPHPAGAGASAPPAASPTLG